jgi:hypothetical protein
MRLAIRNYECGKQEIVILNLLVDRTYAPGKERALIPSLDYVHRLTTILGADCCCLATRGERLPHRKLWTGARLPLSIVAGSALVLDSAGSGAMADDRTARRSRLRGKASSGTRLPGKQ